jgi:hypothetical protein
MEGQIPNHGGEIWTEPATLVDDSLTRESQPEPQAVLLACCNERLE